MEWEASQGVKFYFYFLNRLFGIELRVGILRISQNLIDYSFRTAGDLVYGLIIDQLEHATFLNEIYLNSGFLSTKDILRFIGVVS